jgi:hypothetical protein
VSDDLMASNTLGLIGVELYRLHVGPVAAGVNPLNLTFAAVQTDWKWLVWYVFYDDASQSDSFQSLWNGDGTRAADIYGHGFGRSHHEFRRVFLHLTAAMRIDGLSGGGAVADRAPAVMFAHNSLRKDDNVFVNIDIHRTDGVLQLRRLHLNGKIPKEFDAKGTRGSVIRTSSPTIYKPQDLADPPQGLETHLD